MELSRNLAFVCVLVLIFLSLVYPDVIFILFEKKGFPLLIQTTGHKLSLIKHFFLRIKRIKEIMVLYYNVEIQYIKCAMYGSMNKKRFSLSKNDLFGSATFLLVFWIEKIKKKNKTKKTFY